METGPGLDEGRGARLDCVMEKSLGDVGTLPRDILSLSCSGLEKSRPAVREPSSVSWERPPVKVLAGPSVFRTVRTYLLTSEGHARWCFGELGMAVGEQLDVAAGTPRLEGSQGMNACDSSRLSPCPVL